MDKLLIKYRTAGKAQPPRPIRLDVPGWAGSADLRMQNGSEPQPWHCPPFVDGSAYGMELVYHYETECHVINDSGEIRFQWDFAKEPGGVLGPDEFGIFAPKPTKFYFFAASVDLQAPPGHALRTQPHPRFYTDDTGTVPPALVGHVQSEWWAKKLFVVFKVPARGQRHVFRKGEPYVQILFVPQRMAYEGVPMTPEEEARRRQLESDITLSKSHVARHVWHNPAGSEFNDHYKMLARAFAREGTAGVDQMVHKAVEEQGISLPKGRTVPEYLDLAFQYWRQGKYVEAKYVYFHVRKLDPNNAEAASGLGTVAASMGLGELAINRMERAVALQPQSSAYHNNLGEMLRRAGRFAEAESSFRSALQLRPGDSQVMSSLGLTIAQQGRLDEGLELCRGAAETGPQSPLPHFRMGLIQAQQKQYETARASYNAALAIDPDFSPARRALQELPGAAKA